MQLLDFPATAPGKCAVCGNGGREDGRKYVDLGVPVRLYGRIYLCTHCATEIGKFVGLTGDQKDLREKFANALIQIDRLIEENSGLRSALSELSLIGDPPVNQLSDDSIEESGEGVPGEDSPGQSEATEVASGSPEGKPARKTRSVKSTDVEGSPGVRGDDPLAGYGKSSGVPL